MRLTISVTRALALVLALLVGPAHAQMTLLGAGGSGKATLPPVSITFQGSGNGSSSGTQATFGTLTLGAAASSNRRVCVIFATVDLATGVGDTLVSALFTPNAGGTVNADTLIAIGNDAAVGHALVCAVLPLGTTSTLAVTLSGTAFNSPRFAFYTLDNSTLSSPTSHTTAYSSTTSSAVTSLTTGVNTQTGGAVVAQFSGGSGTGSYTAGVTGSDGSFGSFLWGHVASVAAASPFNVTDTWAGSNNPASLGLVAFR